MMIDKTIQGAEDVPYEFEFKDKDVHLLSIRNNVEKYALRLNAAYAENFRLNASSAYDDAYNRSFFARVYRRGGKKARNVVLVYNGLDEVHATVNRGSSDLVHQNHERTGRLFDFYDDAGQALARQGYLVILLPTPYHLNRSLVFRDPEASRKYSEENETRWVNRCRPTEALKYDPSLLYRNHVLGACESFTLARFIAGRKSDLPFRVDEIIPPLAQHFLNRWVQRSPRPQISLLGYSLGGLRALTDYIFDRETSGMNRPLFSACASFSSGGRISEYSRPHWVDETEWNNIVDALRVDPAASPTKTLKELQNVGPELAKFSKQYMRTHARVLHSRDHPMLSNGGSGARRTAQRGLFFVLGGADDLFPLESVTTRFERDGGVTIINVAGVGHIYGSDTHWQRWKHIAFDATCAFLDETVRAQNVDGEMAKLARFVAVIDHLLAQRARRKKEAYVGLQFGDKRITNGKIEAFTEAARERSNWLARRIAKAGCDGIALERIQNSIMAMIRDFHLNLERQLVRPRTYTKARERFALGMIAFRMKAQALKEPFWDRRDAIPRFTSSQGASLQIGDWLVKHGYLSEEARLGAVKEQERRTLGAVAGIADHIKDRQADVTR